MEKIFTPNRWFVLFCALLIVIVGALKIVSDMNLASLASEVGKDVFSWTWPDKNIASSMVEMKSHILRRDAHDAVVEVSGRQIITSADQQQKTDESDAKATLTFYRLNDKWELGKVELK